MTAVKKITSVPADTPQPAKEQTIVWLKAIASERNREAFAGLYKHFAPRVKSYMIRQGADAAGADDLAQETMVQVWRKAEQYNPAKAVPAAWIFRIARNLQIDRLRRQKLFEVELTAEVDRADDDTLLAYASGTLTEGFSLVVAAHLAYCPRCRNNLAEAEALGGELMAELPPVSMETNSLHQVWKHIEAAPPIKLPKPPKYSKDTELPAVLSTYLDASLDSIRWRTLVPGIRHYPLSGINSGRGSVRLLSIASGMTIPQHTHRGSEMALILKGAYADEIGHFKRGDLAEMDETVHHQPVVDAEEPCICLMASDERICFTGFFSRMLQPVIGI